MQVMISPGRKLEYEIKYCGRHKHEGNLMTVVEFSNENPQGKAVALLNLKCGVLKVYLCIYLYSTCYISSIFGLTNHNL